MSNYFFIYEFYCCLSHNDHICREFIESLATTFTGVEMLWLSDNQILCFLVVFLILELSLSQTSYIIMYTEAPMGQLTHSSSVCRTVKPIDLLSDLTRAAHVGPGPLCVWIIHLGRRVQQAWAYRCWTTAIYRRHTERGKRQLDIDTNSKSEFWDGFMRGRMNVDQGGFFPPLQQMRE